MNLAQTFALALRALLRNKTRSLLTTLGVMIGVASVISMVAVGEGAKAQVESVFSAMGTNMLIVLSGSTSSGGVMGGFGRCRRSPGTTSPRSEPEAPAVRFAAPTMTARVTLSSEDANWTTGVIGTSPDYFDIRAWSIAYGSSFSADDVDSSARVIVIGQTVADKLFGPRRPRSDASVRLRSVPFQVDRRAGAQGPSPMGQDYDDVALVPVTTFQTKIQGGLQKFIAGAIVVSATSAADTTRAQREITAILRDRHHLASATEDDFSIRNLTEIAPRSSRARRR